MSKLLMWYSEDSVFQGAFQTLDNIQTLQSQVCEDQFYQEKKTNQPNFSCIMQQHFYNVLSTHTYYAGIWGHVLSRCH